MDEASASSTAGPSTPAGGSPIDRLMNKPAEVKRWWGKLTESFDVNFLILIAAVYFLQGLGGFATFTQGYYLRESYETSCPGCVDGSQPECDVEGCHAGLALSPGAQQALKATAGLPWNYKLFYGITSDCVPILGSNRRSCE
jgi:hypothetical protein